MSFGWGLTQRIIELYGDLMDFRRYIYNTQYGKIQHLYL